MRQIATLRDIEQLYRERYADYLRAASAITENRDAGRDAVHEAFVAAVRSRDDYRGDGELAAWLWPMVVRSALKRRRRNSREVPTEPVSERAWTEREGEEPAGIREAVAALPRRQRLIVFLRYYGDLDYKTIANAIGIEVGTVGAELHAAHRSLRRNLEEVLSR